MPEFQSLPGFRDFYPADFAVRAHIANAWRDTARRYAFEEYDGPPLEPLDLYTEKSGDEIVGQLYNFTDKGGREVALRPEMTPTLARMAGARAGGMLKPYDIAALIPIVTGAGGVVTNWEGKPAQAGGRIVAAGDPRVHEAALKLLNS